MQHDFHSTACDLLQQKWRKMCRIKWNGSWLQESDLDENCDGCLKYTHLEIERKEENEKIVLLLTSPKWIYNEWEGCICYLNKLLWIIMDDFASFTSYNCTILWTQIFFTSTDKISRQNWKSLYTNSLEIVLHLIELKLEPSSWLSEWNLHSLQFQLNTNVIQSH